MVFGGQKEHEKNLGKTAEVGLSGGQAAFVEREDGIVAGCPEPEGVPGVSGRWDFRTMGTA